MPSTAGRRSNGRLPARFKPAHGLHYISGVNVQVLIPAAGMGTRLGADNPKGLVEIAGVPLLVHTLRKFEAVGLLNGLIVAAAAGYEVRFERALAEHYPEGRFHVLTGGAERQDSVRIGLAALERDTELVVIHDAARPFVATETIQAAIRSAAAYGAATVATPCTDTILEATEDGMLDSTPDRRRLWSCQTPQVFRVEIIRHAHEGAAVSKQRFTDDATMVNKDGAPVKIVAGSQENFKITTPADLHHATLLLREPAL